MIEPLASKRRKPGNTRDPLRDCAGTPPDFFAKLHAKYNFTVDACALPWNTKLPRYWAPPDFDFDLWQRVQEGSAAWPYRPASLDGLTQDWTGERVWVNPPYGKGLIEPWVDKALERNPGTRYEPFGPLKADLVVMLLPSRTEMLWFHRLWTDADVEVVFLARRVQFVAPPGLGQDFKKSSNFERSFLAVIR